ncbi:Trichome birefringence-like, N-terminal domain [Dillenia turbinata]|uniref:Trichome birefringence-like, N-terminal domain n=1 Tax=Dillenia turbinata TaxID=194707 RepID=A0AAN8UQV0_9MAGN
MAPRNHLSFLFLSLLCFTSLSLLLSFLKNSFLSSSSPSPVISSRTIATRQFKHDEVSSGGCDFSDGFWIHDPKEKERSLARYDETCKEIFKGWNCILAGKSNAKELLSWRWKPKACDLPNFDPIQFLERYRNTNIGFVGDSLNRNMFVSLFCTLRHVSSEVKKWRPAGADRCYTFLKFNLTIGYHRTNLLARYGRWSANANGGVLESLGYKEGYRVDVDIPEGTWAEAPSFHDILILNTGHWWWAPSKFHPQKSPMLFFEKGLPILPPRPPHEGLDMALRHMILYVERRVRPGTIKYFRTQSPRHFEGGDWDQGGSCHRMQPLSSKLVDALFSLSNNGTNTEARLVNQHLYKSLEGSSFNILDVTRMSEFRADAHPSTAGGKKHDDCMHWCLPGITDTWNDLFIAHLSNTRI